MAKPNRPTSKPARTSPMPVAALSTGRFRWQCFLVLVLLLIPTALLTLRPITDSDYWHHLAFGRTLITEHHIPRTDELGSTTADRPWVSSGWIPSILLYQIQAHAIPAPILVFAVMALTLGILIIFCVRGPAMRQQILAAGTLILLTLLAAYPRYLPRPDVFSILLITLLTGYLSHLAAVPLSRTPRGYTRAAVLPLIMILWVNCHMLFIIGLSLAAIFTAWALWETRHRRRPDGTMILVSFLVTMVATLANPYGWRVYWFIWENAHLARTGERINELKPLLGLLTEPGGRFVIGALTCWFAVCIYLIAIQWKQKPLTSWQILIIASLLGLMLIQRRQIGLGTFGITTLILTTLSPTALPPWLGRTPGMILAASAYLGLTTVIASGSVPTIPSISTPLRSRVHADTEWQPAEAIPFLQQNPPPGRLFHDLYSGSYLAYHLAPATKVFIDGRLEVYNNGPYDDFFAPMEGRLSTQALFTKYAIHSALIDWRGADKNPAAIASQLSDDPAWALCWFSDHYALFVRRDSNAPEATAYIAAHGYRYLNPLRPQSFMDALASPGTATAARAEARRAHNSNPTSNLAAMAMKVSGQSSQP